jgi:hypothetical protein
MIFFKGLRQAVAENLADEECQKMEHRGLMIRMRQADDRILALETTVKDHTMAHWISIFNFVVIIAILWLIEKRLRA